MSRADRLFAGLPRSVAAWYAVLFFTGFVAYILLWPSAPVQEGDSSQYLEVAQDLADYRLDHVHDRSVGYPLLLLLTGSIHEPTTALFAVSLGLHFVSVWLLATLLHRAGMTHRWLLAFCGVLLLPLYVEPAAHVMTENLAQFTLVVGLVCLVLSRLKPEMWLLPLSSAAFGFAALTRPIYQALALAIAGSVLVLAIVFRNGKTKYRDSVIASVVVIAGSTMVIAAVAYMNHVKFGYFALTPTLGFHLSTKTMSFVERLPDEYAVVREILVRVRNEELTKRGGPHTGTQTIWAARSELQAATGLSQPELSRYLVRMNVELIGRAPLEYLQEVARSLSVYWFPPTGPLASMNSTALRWTWLLVYGALVLVFWLQLIVFAGLGIFNASGRWPKPSTPRTPDPPESRTPELPNTVHAQGYCLAATIVFYTMVLSCVVDIGEMRQRRSTDVLIVFMTFLGSRLWQQLQQNYLRPSTSAQDGRSAPE